MDKIKAFFSSKVVKYIAWALLIASEVVLIIGGATQEALSSVVAMVVGIAAAIAELIIFISGLIKKE